MCMYLKSMNVKRLSKMEKRSQTGRQNCGNCHEMNRSQCKKKDKNFWKEFKKDFQRTHRRDKKQYKNNICKDIEDVNRHGKQEKSSKNLSAQKEILTSNWYDQEQGGQFELQYQWCTIKKISRTRLQADHHVEKCIC